MVEKFIDAVGKIDHFDLPRASETRFLGGLREYNILGIFEFIVFSGIYLEF